MNDFNITREHLSSNSPSSALVPLINRSQSSDYLNEINDEYEPGCCMKLISLLGAGWEIAKHYFDNEEHNI